MAQTADGVWVASQVKALLATGRVAREPDPVAQAGFYLLGSVAEPRTWFAGIAALGSGECLWIDDGRVANRRTWACIGAAWRRANDASPASPDALQADVTAALRESVGRHLVADVPVGVFLSGGVDSGALAGLMLDAGARDLQGVTIAYDEFRGQHEDEAPVAAAIAHRYGIRHHVRRVTRDEFLSDLPRILDAMDQPSIDGVNTWFASKAVAEQGLKVVVSGVGGDELFFGYELFSELPRIVRARQWLARVPGSERPLAALARLQARRTGNLRWSHAADWTKSVEGAWWLRKGLFAPDDLMRLVGEPLTGEWVDRFDARSEVGRIAGPLPGNPKLALAQIESTGYLRNQLLRDSDWASMAHSVELRTPLVDMHRLATLAPRLAELSRVPGKRCLALAPRQPLPDEVIRRRKTGFGIPVARWLREAGYTEPGVGPSQAWARVVAARAYG